MSDMGLALRLKKVREDFGFSIDEAARLAEMTPTRLGEIEGGGQLTVTEYNSVANALAFDAAMFDSGADVTPERSVARFRASHGLQKPSPRDLRLLARAAEVGRVGAFLWEALSKPPSPIVSARQICAVTASEPAIEGYKLGEDARERLSPRREPILSLQDWLETNGVHVAFVPFESTTIEAASLFEVGSLPLILINSSIGRAGYNLTRRAILAHEICHLLHDGGERDMSTVSMASDSDPVERRAKGFGPAFLVPAGWIQLKARDNYSIAIELASTWGLSFEGAVWRAKTTGRFTKDDVDALLHSRRRRIVEASAFEPEIPRTPPDAFEITAEPTALVSGLVSELAIQAVVEGRISRGRAVEILRIK